jgi:SAM-dependent methyltransferase
LSTSRKTYLNLAAHYRECLKKYGDRSRGMDWPRAKDNQRRFAVMTEMFERDLASGRPVRVLDFGCGTSHFYEYLRSAGLAKRIRYTGLDIVPESITISREKFPGNKYLCLDILASRKHLGSYDYVVINGVFTQKRGMTEREMSGFLERVLTRLHACYRKGLAFNAMSDFKRRGSFHLDLDWAGKLFARTLTRHFVVRHDYGLYENTFYLFKMERRS